MDDKIRELLQNADDPVYCEAPPMFNYDEAMARVKALKPQLEHIIGYELELNDHVQDASFFTHLSIYIPINIPAQLFVIYICISFSAFGNLFAVQGNDETKTPIVLQNIISALASSGFKYVDENSLSELYDGKNPYFKGQNWGYRFFDYC